MAEIFDASLNRIDMFQQLRDLGVEFIGSDKALIDEYSRELLIQEQMQAEAASLGVGDEVRMAELEVELPLQTTKVIALHRRVAAKVIPLVNAVSSEAN